MNPSLVISAYNRPAALARLLDSLARAKYPPGREIPLVISLDRGENGFHPQVVAVAEGFAWEYGEKQVLYPREHLGLVEHFYRCGSLTQSHEAVILLEDDLLVSPMFYYFAAQSLAFYQDDPRLAGVSLYALWFNGYTHYPFIPLPDESDIFFLQIPYTQGQAFTRSQWERFAEWQANGDRRLRPGDPVHEMFLHFDAQDWFPLRTKYLVETGRYYVFPRQSLATGMGDPGTHFSAASAFFQVPLQRFQEEYRLKPLDQSPAVYDSFFEILPDRLSRLTDVVRGYPCDVDLNATKSLTHLKAEYVLTLRGCRSPLRTFGLKLWPPEANLIEAVPGTEISLCKASDLNWGRLAEWRARKRLYDYYSRRHPIRKKLRLQFALLEILEHLGRGASLIL